MDKDKKVCYCFNITVDDISKSIENGSRSFRDVKSNTSAGTSCGKCRSDIKKVTLELLNKK